MINQAIFKDLTRDGKPIAKTYNDNEEALWQDVKKPSSMNDN